MNQSRRAFLASAGIAVASAALPLSAAPTPRMKMYGLIGKMKVADGERDRLISILLEGISGMPGCLSYVVAEDPTDPEAIWVTEVWESQESHRASLSLPSVQQAIARGRPLITGFGERFETVPVGGWGLTPAPADV